MKERGSLGPGQEAMGRVLVEEMRGMWSLPESRVWQGESSERKAPKRSLRQESGGR